MGLDMYLHAEVFVSGYDFRGDEEVARFKGIVEAMGMTDVVDTESPHVEIRLTLGYWRKANAIHRWFVEHVQGGEDECRPHDVSNEQLQELRERCQEVLDSLKMTEGMVHTGTQLAPEYKEHYEPGKVPEDSRVAREKLPTTAGFFFGSTDYDEWYVADLEHTVKVIDRTLAWLEKFEGSFGPRVYYQSSW